MTPREVLLPNDARKYVFPFVTLTEILQYTPSSKQESDLVPRISATVCFIVGVSLDGVEK